MGYFISAEFGYYEGDRLGSTDVEVPQRPDHLHTWSGSAWVADADLLAAQLRTERDAKLTACDWLVIRHVTQAAAGADTTLAAAEYQELLTYLQALRDLTAQEGFPTSVTWPTAPGFVE